MTFCIPIEGQDADEDSYEVSEVSEDEVSKLYEKISDAIEDGDKNSLIYNNDFSKEAKQKAWNLLSDEQKEKAKLIINGAQS